MSKKCDEIEDFDFGTFEKLELEELADEGELEAMAMAPTYYCGPVS